MEYHLQRKKYNIWTISAKIRSTLERHLTFEFSRNKQSWECWQFCTSWNGNELEIVASWMKFTEKLHWSWCFKLKLKLLAKVIFLHLSVILFTGGVWSGGLQFFRGGLHFFGGGGWGSPIWGGSGLQSFGGGSPIFGGLQFFGGISNFSGGGVSPPEYGHRSAGTHPTGMHSCW